jgi:translocator assembly and maintenance protein 41
MKIAPIKTAVRLTSIQKMSSLQTNPYDTDQLPPSMEKKHEQDTIPLRREPLFSDDTRAKLKRLREHHFHPSNLPDSPEFGTNQYMDINEELKKQLKAIVSTFNAPIRYAVAYGDGLLKGKEV